MPALLNAYTFYHLLVSLFVKDKTCPPLEAPLYGQYQKCNNSLGEKCYFACENGFHLIGPSYRTCLYNGEWSNSQPYCINRNISCPQISIENGTLSFCEPFAGSRCTYTCINFITLQQVNCQKNGQWSRSLPLCIQQLKCQTINSISNGQVSQGCTNANEGDICSFTCFSGFYLQGPSQIKCIKGHWSFSVPTCQRLLTPLRNGFSTCTKDLFVFQCNQGYILSGNSSLKYVKTILSGQQPICHLISCSIIEKIQNDPVLGPCTTPGSICNFSCNRDYKLNGLYKVLCNQFSNFNSSLPFCLQVTCKPLTLNSAKLPNSHTCNYSIVGQYSFRCHECTIPVDNAVVLFNEVGQWNSTFGSCMHSKCKSLISPKEGFLIGICSPCICGSYCNFSCGLNYRNEQNALCCSSEGWKSSDIIKCTRIKCLPLPHLINGFHKGQCNPGLAGESCEYECQTGFTLSGNSIFHCTNSGNWSSNILPSCIRLVCPSLFVRNAVLTGSCQKGYVSEKCHIKCNPNFTLQGNETIICNSNGMWSDPIPLCLPVQSKECQPLYIPDGHLSGNCSPGIPGYFCYISCSFGFNLIGAKILTCQENGLWNKNPPICLLITCPFLRKPEYGYYSGNCISGLPGKTCRFFCNEGYNLNGPSSLECLLNSSWSNSPPQCVPITCETLDPPAPGGKLQGYCNPGIAGKKCNFICPFGYLPNGPNSALCNINGTWSDRVPRCHLYACVSLLKPICGKISGFCAPGIIGHNCTFSCHKECKLNGKKTLTCTKRSEWSDLPPVCEPINNSGLIDNENQKNYNTNNESYIDDSNNNNKDAISDSDGTIDDTDTIASPSSDGNKGVIQNCPTLFPPFGGLLVGKCIPGIEGRYCKLVCGKRFRLTGRGLVRCTKKGIWNGRLGICTTRYHSKKILQITY